MRESAENAIEDQVQDLRLSLVVTNHNRQSNHPKIRSLQTEFYIYFTFSTVDVALVCQTRKFQAELLVCMLCFPNIVYVIFVRTVSFRNFHLNHGHILAWFLKEQEAHFNENIIFPVIKIMISCFFDKFRDIILIVFIYFFYKESKLLIQQMLYFVPTFFWETHFALQRTD